MIPTRRNIHGAPTREVRGDFPVHYHYTVGDIGERFFNGLKEMKIVANHCSSCSKTYLPPRMFCEDCFDELTEDTLRELDQTAILFSFTKVYHDHKGKPLKSPFYLGLIKVEGSDTTFFHKIVDTESPSIGMKLQPVWASERSATLFDLEGFRSA